MHPAIIIFALIAGEHSYGIVGAVLAVPIASVIQTMYLFFKNNRWQHSAPVEEPGSDQVAGSET
jgi:predicted PurR-regulated permease PerM